MGTIHRKCASSRLGPLLLIHPTLLSTPDNGGDGQVRSHFEAAGNQMHHDRVIETEARSEVWLLDDELIAKARGGDIDAYAELVRRYQDVAFRTAYLITREAGAAEDAAQEAFLRAHRALSRFQEGHSFRPWLLKIVTNEARRRQASVLRDRRLELQLLSERATTSAGWVEAQVLLAERRATLEAAIKHLPVTDQIVLAYRYGLELSESEMALAMDCSKGTVKSRLSRSIGRLRQILGQQDREPLTASLQND